MLGPGVPAAGLTPADFASARRGNDASAFVAAVPAADCRTTRPERPRSAGSAPFTGRTDAEPGLSARVDRDPPQRRITALIDIRHYAVVRRGTPRLLLDADGSVRLMPR